MSTEADIFNPPVNTTILSDESTIRLATSITTTTTTTTKDAISSGHHHHQQQQQQQQRNWHQWLVTLLPSPINLPLHTTLHWLWKEGLAYGVVTTLMYAIYGFNLVIIGFALRFTWQWLVDDVQTHNTTDHPTRRAWFLVIYTWFNMELVFYAYQYWLIRRSQTIKPGPSFELTHRRRLFDYTRSYARQNGVEMAKGWFLGSQLHEVRRDNGLEWLAWAFFHRPCNELSTGETRELHEMLVEIQRDVPSFATELGRDDNVRCMRLNLDPVRVFPRPLMVYFIIQIGQLFTELCLRGLGFQREKTPHLTYWYRPPTNATSNASPIVFVHGLTLGLTPYLFFFIQLFRRHGNDRPIVLLHLGHLAYRFPRLTIPSRVEIIESITHMFERHQLAPAIWMGHSFGTIICSWMCNLPNRERYLTRTILVDPVCFQLWEPGLVYNAIYRPPPNWLLQLMRCVVSSEHGIALTLGRHFWWHENILLPESLTPGSHIIVAEHDGIIDARKLSDYLTSNQVSHSVLPRAIHAQFLLQLSTASNILELI